MDEDQSDQKDEKVEIKDNSKRARIVTVIFGILIGINLVCVVTGYFTLQFFHTAGFEEYISDYEINIFDLDTVLRVFQMGIYITSVVVFLNWFRRAYANLHRLKIPYLKHKESMALWAWVFPIIWFYRPVQIMNEIWTVTQREIKRIDASYIITRGRFVIGLWWTLFILSNFIGRYVLQTAFKQDTVEQMTQSTRATLFSDIAQLPEALLVIFIVFQLSKMESRLAGEIKKSGGDILEK